MSARLINGIKTDYCFKIEENGCHGDHKFNCDSSFCAKDKVTCHKLTVFRASKNLHKYDKDYHNSGCTSGKNTMEIQQNII